jgi:8-oxo-dGTP pyrophosphatase MutT (NUDIX family)
VERADGALAHGLMTTWHALAEATRAERRRVPFFIGEARVGSVAVEHLAPLRALRGPFDVDGDAVRWHGSDADFATLHRALRDAAHIVAWRDETFPIVDVDTLLPLAHVERAAARFWGTLTFGAHATGYVAGADGRPERLWIARRAFTKATDPGLYDNLVGGGVPAGQTPAEALVREGFEEAGLTPEQMAPAQFTGILRLARDIPEGFQHEWLYSYDLALPPGVLPLNQDGEVHGFTCMPAAEALALAATERMTVDAALVTIDFGLRHGLIQDDTLARCVQRLKVVRKS